MKLQKLGILLILCILFIPSVSVYAVPTLTIDSPENITYNNSEILLNWSTDINLTTITYNLNYNVTNTSLINLTDILFDNWTKITDITIGLPDVGTLSTPTMFIKDSTWYLITNNNAGDFYGFNWTGSLWQSDPEIITGLTDVTYGEHATTFYRDTTLYMIIGQNAGTYLGYNWSYLLDAWQSDPTIINGITYFQEKLSFTVFNINSTEYLISGGDDGTFRGYNWSIDTWQIDTAIIQGLGDVSRFSQPHVFELNDTIYMIYGSQAFGVGGKLWDGITWISYPDIIEGINTTFYSSGDLYSYALVYMDTIYINNTLYSIFGNHKGTFIGHQWQPAINIYEYINTTVISQEGLNTLHIYTIDNESNDATQSIYFTVDTIIPQIVFLDPTPADMSTVQTATAILNISVTEDNIDTITLSWNNTNETMISTSIVKEFDVDGSYPFYACVNDTIGNVNCTETRTVTSEYQSYQAYLVSIATLTSTKAFGEIPAGAILGLTENVTVPTAINFVILLVIIGFSIFGYTSIKNPKG